MDHQQPAQNSPVKSSSDENKEPVLPPLSPSDGSNIVSSPPAPPQYVCSSSAKPTDNVTAPEPTGSGSKLIPQPPPKSPEEANSLEPDILALLPPRLAQLSDEKRKRLFVANCDTEQYIQNVEAIVDVLMHESLSLIDDSSKLIQLYRLISAAIVIKKCDMEMKEKAVQALIKKGWMKFLMNSFLLVIDEVEKHQNGWEKENNKTTISNLTMGLMTLTFIMKRCAAETATEICNAMVAFLIQILDHPVLLTAEADPINFRKKLLAVLDDIARLEVLRKEISSSQLEQIETVLCKYIERLSSLSSDCQRALYLLGDVDVVNRLPLQKLIYFAPTTESLESDIADCQKTVRRLNSISMETHVWKPWRVYLDFSYMISVMNQSKFAQCSPTTCGDFYAAIVRDGMWYKFVSELYLHVIDSLKRFKEGSLKISSVAMDGALKNLYYALSTLHNGTDYCKDAQILQLTVDHFSDMIIEQLKNPVLLNILAKDTSESSNDGENLLVEIGDALLSIVHNLTFYFEPCIPTLREKGMMSVARNVRELAYTSDIKTSCLLIIAYLIDEGDSKDVMKITDNELSFLIREVRLSMEPERKSGYHPEELIEGLTRIAGIDHNKLKVIEQGALPLLVRSLDADKYNADHQAAAAKAIWNLAFTDESRQKIIEEEGCLEALHKLQNSENRKVKNAVGGALWQIEEKISINRTLLVKS
ncbi:hypothetical protein EB796_002545 [Bugula neritina]|uniref:Uncharacterized protein n=1 Tax=Bugula neritina TaxID=10212 RepID=A0A7J7KLW6_BUGNE|nr:hypothetical protein EB796_002545 [Bugula neritina]